MSTYTYHGEAELLVPFTLDGPKVLEAGEQVRLLDSDTSLDAHPLFTKDGAEPDRPQAPAQAAPEPTPAPTPEPAPIVAPAPAQEPAPSPEPNPASDPEQAPDAPAEPTA